MTAAPQTAGDGEGVGDGRIAVFAPLAGDAAALAEAIGACGLSTRICPDPESLAEQLVPDQVDGTLCLLITEEGAGLQTAALLAEALAEQPSWSSLPVLFLVRNAAAPPPGCEALRTGPASVQVALLERPVRPAVLAGVIATQVSLRQRQFETRDLLERLGAAERRQGFLLNELRHRTRNTLAVLQALFRLTARSHSDVESFVAAFSTRLRVLSDAHVRLAEEGQGSARLHDIFHEHAVAYCPDPEQLEVAGPKVSASARLAFDLAMAANELATNAAKYGALSVTGGKVRVSWQWVPPAGPDGAAAEDDAPRDLEIVWREQGGPPVREPTERRIGSQLIGNVGRDVGGSSRTEFRPDGLVWTLRLPAECLATPED